MDPNVWGPKFWFSLHSVSMTYPFYPDEEDKRRYKSFYELLEFVLPCALCRENYRKNLLSYPIDKHLKDRKSLVYWVIDVHNMVNVENGKPTLTYNEALDIYERQFGRKIMLEDPDPKGSKKKLDDTQWQRRRMERRKNVVMRGGVFGLGLMFIVLLVLLVFMMNR